MSTAATTERWCLARLLHSLAMTVFSAEPSAADTVRIPSIARRLKVSPASKWIALSANLGYRHYAHNLERFYNCDWIIGRERVDDHASRRAS